ncbi:MAG: hypothetical protein ACI81R_003445, partial [Bradymonadia bacterium]
GATFRRMSIEAAAAAPGVNRDAGDSGAGGNDGLPPFYTLGAPAVSDTCYGFPQDYGLPGSGGDAQVQVFEFRSFAGQDGSGSAAVRGIGGGGVTLNVRGISGTDATAVTFVPAAAGGGANSNGEPSFSSGTYSAAAGWTRASGATGPNGSHGGGGGGGGGAGMKQMDGRFFSGNGGASGGTAGCRGTGGRGGSAGGSSLGLVLVTSDGIVFEHVEVTAGSGGSGGVGGSGGQGGLGGAGASNEVFGIGFRGGLGGAGSGGSGAGGGGGGAGGSSYAVFRDGATGIPSGGITMSRGTPGLGGAGGAGGLGGPHGDVVNYPSSSTGPSGLNGADGQALQQRVF